MSLQAQVLLSLLMMVLVWPVAVRGEDPEVACLKKIMATEKRTSLKAVAQVDLEAKKKKLHFDLVVEAKAPNQMRFEMLDDFGQTVYQFEGDERQFKKTFGFKLKAEDWVELLLGRATKIVSNKNQVAVVENQCQWKSKYGVIAMNEDRAFPDRVQKKNRYEVFYEEEKGNLKVILLKLKRPKAQLHFYFQSLEWNK